MRLVTLAAAFIAIAFARVVAAQGAGGGPPEGSATPVVITAERSDLSPSLAHISPKAVQKLSGIEVPRHKLPIHRGPAAPAAPVDPVVQDALGPPSMPSTANNFEGVSNVNGVLPADPNGDVGPNHYFQTVNVSFAIFSKDDGTLLYGPAAGNTLFSGFGGPCEAQNDGDPIVLYDHLADRWLFSQLAIPNNFLGLLFAPFYQCIAISATPDPTGPYYRYQFAFSKLNDYPKFGVWPDGYYMTINQYEELTLAWAGQGAAVFDRQKMLAGQPASGVLFDMSAVDLNLGGMLPSDLDGPPPPVGTPNYFMQLDDDAWGYSGDQLQLWAFGTKWNAPLTSTFTRVANLGTAPFDSNLCGYARNCLPQPGTTVKLDALSDRLMFRLQYRNFGTHESLVVNHTVDADGQDHAGVRWYEIRNPSSAPIIFQQGTYAPDSDHRWSASAAMDTTGNIVLGFSAVGGLLFPSIRYAGRLAGDPLGTLPQGEGEIVAGGGAQTHDSGRWGDYSGLVVDPVDGCTFYYTQEYYTGTSAFDWRTRVGSFRFPSCGGGSVNVAPLVTIQQPTDAATVSGNVAIRIQATDDLDLAGSLTVQWNIDGDAWKDAAYDGIDSYTANWDSTGTIDGAHTLNVRATDSGGLVGTDSHGVSVSNASPPPPSSVHVGDLDGTTSGNKSTWTARVTIVLHDTNHQLVNGALATGTWSGGATGSASCTTINNGTCVIVSNSLRKRDGSATFSVTGVSVSGLTYVVSQNHDPDGDSNGTTITMTKP